MAAMQHGRYEILDQIAVGDFATVYRARDRDLGREVAVKQIHPQFLNDERQLARYWQEAQLLASLQHPNIVTIYDIVRPRGWLILELMRTNLQQMTAGQPIDLDFLRRVLVGCLGALEFLHRNGVIHGDIKPSNMLVDAQGRVKLGDFGLARRASNEEGSLLKGTTKYMAPELLSNQFGPIGPASDLYSLGFAAYELMCGSQFDALFPTLGSFGRDRQIAWMMWHAAPDRQLPEIRRVLEGVPPDLAHVIQRLTIKDPSRRYRSASEVLRDLPAAPGGVEPPPPPEDAALVAARETALRKKKRLRLAAVGALLISAALSVAMLMPERKPPAEPPPPEPTEGVIAQVYPDEWRLAVVDRQGAAAVEIGLNRYARVFVNDRPSVLRELRPQDRVVIDTVRDSAGRVIREIRAYRPVVDRGRIKEVKPDEGTIAVSIEEGERRGEEIVVNVPPDLKILFNDRDTIDGRGVALADLQVDDRVEIAHIGELRGQVATQLRAERLVTVEGVIREVDAKKGRLRLSRGTTDGGEMVDLPVAPDCEVTLNDRRVLDEKMLKPADLKPGDRATIAHDTRIVRINAHRVLGDAGMIRRVRYDDRAIDVLRENGQVMTYLIGPQCEITLGGEPIRLTDLRAGDNVDIKHDTPGVPTPTALRVAAQRPADRTRWAILIATQAYEDVSLSPIEHPVEDAKLLRDALVKRYQVPDEQVLMLLDENRVRIEQSVPDRLRRAGTDGKVLVYYAGHAYRAVDGTVYLAAKNFDFKLMDQTGLRLQWLVDEMEKAPAAEKLLLLDCAQQGKRADVAMQPSTAEMLASLKAPPGRAPLRTVTAIASCQSGQRGLVLAATGRGVFATALAEAFSGAADKNYDNHLETTELFAYLDPAIAAKAAEAGGNQSPKLFLPDDRPPRLSDDARAAIRKLAAYLRQGRPTNRDAAAAYDMDVAATYAQARQLAGAELEPQLIYGLLLLKDRRYDDALRHFEQLKIEHPELLLPLRAIVFIRFDKRTYKTAAEELRDMVRTVLKPSAPGEPYSEEARELFFLAGQLREFASSAVEPPFNPPAEVLDEIDQAVAAHGADAAVQYEQGRQQTRNVGADFDRKITGAQNEAEAIRLKTERRRLVHYVDFPFDALSQRVLAGLEN